MTTPEDDLAIFTETEEQSMAVAAATRAARAGLIPPTWTPRPADVTLTRPVTEADEKWIRVLRAGWVAEP